MHDISHETDISKSNAPLHIKFALLCLNKTAFPKWLGFLCFIISHLQFIAIIIKSVYLALDDNTPSSSPAIHLFVKLFVIGDWLSSPSAAAIFTGTVIITIYTVKMLSFMVCIHFALFMKRRIPDLAQKYWGLMHSFHPLVMFFWIHTFSMEIILHPLNFEGAQGVRIIAFINTVVNCLLAVFFSIISVTYKTKNVLSSKTNLLETETVIFKIIIPTLWEIAETNQGVQIFVLILSLGKTVLHDWIFIKYLPYYRINMLILSSVLQAIQTSLALAGCIIKFVEAGGAHIGVFTFQIVGLLFVPLAIKAYHSCTWRVLLYILGCEVKNEKNLYYLVHKRFILLYLLKSRKAIHGGINKFTVGDILYQARLAEIAKNSGTEELSMKQLDKNKKLLVRSLKTICLEVLKLHPRALLAQISLARAYSKFEDLYLVSNNLLEDALSKRPWYHAQISLNMIRLELQNKLKLEFSEKTGQEGLNVHSYIINNELHEEMKINIRKQAEMQRDFWTEFMSNKPSMMKLVSISLEVNHQRKIVRRLWSNLMKIRSPSFLSPLVVYGMYSSLINNNPIEGGKCIEQSQDDAKKMDRLFKADELNNQTMFSEKSVQITMAGLKSKLGKIMDCSANIANFYGWQANELKGRPVISLMPPFFRHRHDGFLLNHFNTGKTKIMNKTIIVPVKRANGYIHPTWIHVKVSPLMDHGMSYVSLLRPCKSSQRMILVRENGKIDDMSFEFAKDMNLLKKEDQHDTDILRLCPEFREINEAFNTMAEGAINQERTEEVEDIGISPKNNKRTREDLLLSERSLLSKAEEGSKTTDRPLLTGTGTLTARNLKIPLESEIPRMKENNKARSICDNFIKGSTLMFYPRNESQPVTYSVKINNSIHGKDTIKIVLLERVDNRIEQLTDEEDAVVSSFQGMTDEFPMSPKKDALLSPRAFTQSLVTGYETEGADLISLATSPRERIALRFFEPMGDVTEGSILDEVQEDDSAMRRTLSRKFFKGKNSTSGSPRRKNQAVRETLPTEVQSVLFTEQNERGLLSEKKVRKSQTQTVVPKEPVNRRKNQQNKQARLKQGVAKNVTQIEKSVGSSYLSKGKKAEQLVIKALKGEPKKRSASIFTCFFMLFLLTMAILLIVQNINLRAGIRDVEAQVPVISAGFFRQYNMVYSALEILQFRIFLTGTFTISGWQDDKALLWGYLVYYLVRMKDDNTRFYELLNKLPGDVQSKFYKKTVGIYEYDEERNKKLVGMFSTFEAFQLMLEKEFSCLNMYMPDQFEPGIDVSNHYFIQDNILNDLWIESQNQNVQLTEDLDNSTERTTLKMGVTTIGALVACGIFIAVSIRYLWVIATEARIFMITVFRIKRVESEAVGLILKHFISALNAADVGSRGFQAAPKTMKTIAEDQQSNNASANLRFRKASMKSFYRSLRIAFLKLLPVYFLFVCWSIGCFFLASNFMRNIEDSKNRMQAVLQSLNNQVLIAYEQGSMTLTNGTDIVINKPIKADYPERLKSLVQVDRFVDSFRDKNGELTALQEKVLYDFRCEDLVPLVEKDYEKWIYTYVGCIAISKGSGSAGLMEINSELYTTCLHVLETYENSEKTQDELNEIFIDGLMMTGDLMNAAEGFYFMLYDATYESFDENIGSIEEKTLLFTILIVTGTGIATFVTWYWVIKKIFKAQKIDWFILQLIPVKLILGNKHIQQYFLKHSDGMFDGVRRFL